MNSVLSRILLNETDPSNPLIPCLIYNDFEQLKNIKKHSHTFLCYKCENCDKRQIKRADTVSHKNKNTRCYYCSWNNYQERKLFNIIYEKVSEYVDNVHDVVKVQKTIKINGVRCRPDVILEYNGKTLMIELDDSTHLYNKETMRRDKIKMKHARQNNWYILRIYIDRRTRIDEFYKPIIEEQIDNFMNDRGVFEDYLNDFNDRIKNNFIDI